MYLPEGLSCYDSKCIIVFVQRPHGGEKVDLYLVLTQISSLLFFLEDSPVALQNLP